MMTPRVLIFALAVVVPLISARSDPLTTRAYMDLTLARLTLAQDTWERDGRAPTAEEAAALWGRFGTTAEEYVNFRGRHRAEVDAYLAAHPGTGAEIEQRSARIEELARTAEGGK